MKIKIVLLSAVLSASLLSSCSKDPNPVKCDHEIVLQPGPDYGKDAMLFTERPTDNFGYSIDNQVVAWTWYALGFDDGAMRSMIEFDLSAIPANAAIKSARLTMYNNPNSSTCRGRHQSRSGSNAWQIERVLEPWGENTVTWNNQPKTSSSDIINVPESVSEHQDYEVDITSFVKGWYDRPSTNHGMLMRIRSEHYYRSIVFASSDHKDESIRPKLTIVYRK